MRASLITFLNEARTWLDGGYAMSLKYDGNHKGKSVHLNDVSHLEEKLQYCEKNGKEPFLYLECKHDIYKGQNPYICDIDNKPVFRSIAGTKDLSHLKGLIVNESPNGGHFIGLAHPGLIAPKALAKYQAQGGFQADFLPDRVKVFGGPSRKTTLFTPFHELEELPLALRLHANKKADREGLYNKPIKKGTRNNVLCQLSWNSVLPYDERLKVVLFVNAFLCEEPLEHQAILNIVKKDGPSLELITAQDKITIKNVNWVRTEDFDIDLIVKALLGKIVYHPEHTCWYEWLGERWANLSAQDVTSQMDQVIRDHAAEVQTSYSPGTMAMQISRYMGRLEKRLSLPNTVVVRKGLIGFSNGVLDTKTFKWYYNGPGHFTRHTLPEPYIPGQLMSQETQTFLWEFTGGNLIALALIRGLLCSALTHRTESNTVLMFRGSPGVGKSVLTNLIMSYFGEGGLSLNFENLTNNFHYHALVKAEIVCFNEMVGLTPKKQVLFKNITGRDTLSYEFKYKQGTYVGVCEAAFLGTTNESPEVILGKDEGIKDRVIFIEAKSRVGKPDPDLLARLLRDRPATAQWAMTCDPLVLAHTIRAGIANKLLEADEDGITMFCAGCLCFIEGGSVLLKEVKDRYEAFCASNEFEAESSAAKFKSSLLKTCTSTYFLKVTSGRSAQKGFKNKPEWIFGIGFSEDLNREPLGQPDIPFTNEFKAASGFDEATGKQLPYSAHQIPTEILEMENPFVLEAPAAQLPAGQPVPTSAVPEVEPDNSWAPVGYPTKAQLDAGAIWINPDNGMDETGRYPFEPEQHPDITPPTYKPPNVQIPAPVAPPHVIPHGPPIRHLGPRPPIKHLGPRPPTSWGGAIMKPIINVNPPKPFTVQEDTPPPSSPAGPVAKPSKPLATGPAGPPKTVKTNPKQTRPAAVAATKQQLPQLPKQKSKQKVRTTICTDQFLWWDKPNYIGNAHAGSTLSPLTEHAGPYPHGGITTKELKELGYPSFDEILEQNKDLDLIPKTKEEARKIFQLVTTQFREQVYKPLSELEPPALHTYNPHKPNYLYNTCGPRMKYTRTLGPLANYFETLLGFGRIIWVKALLKSRQQAPLGENLKQEKNPAGFNFPYTYVTIVDGSCRQNAYPPHTVRDATKLHKFNICDLIQQHTGFYFYEADLSGAHARIMTIFVGRQKGPWLWKACESKDMWTGLAQGLQNNHPDLMPIPIKTVRKCVKNYTLAMMNGGSLHNPKHIISTLKPLDKEGALVSEGYAKTLAKILSKQPYVNELHEHSKELYKDGQVYTVLKPGPNLPRFKEPVKVTEVDKGKRKSKHTLCSLVYCSVESVLLSLTIEWFGTINFPLIPLAGQHDGLMFVSSEKLSPENILYLAADHKRFIKEKVKIDLDIEIKQVDSN